LLISPSGYSEEIWNIAKPALSKFPSIVASVVYVDGGKTSTDEDSSFSLLKHVAGSSKQGSSKPGNKSSKDYQYPKVKGQWFSAGDADFDYAADSVAHTRNLQFLKPKMGGPYFDLEEIWEEHTYYEFADRSVEHTMSTMVQEPYVNHIPTVSEGVVRCSRHLLKSLPAHWRRRERQPERLLPQQLHLQQLGRHRSGAREPDNRHRPRD
jgi:carboxymethylenebutenolidase